MVRDILGREQVITQPFYASSLLLKEGLRDESYELGFVRNNFGLRSSDYGRFVAAATLRKGVTDRVTTEFRGEVLRKQQTAGVGASVITPLPLVVTAAGAVSRSEAGSGWLLFLAAERVARGIGYGVRSQWTSSSFAQLGLQPGQAPPRQQLSANLGFPVGAGGSLGMSYVRQLNRGRPDSEIAAATYSLRLGQTTSLIFSATTTLSGERTRIFGITLVSAVGDRTAGTASHTSQSGANQTQFQLQQSLPAGSGFGYRLLAGNGASGERKEAGLALQTDTGTYTLDAGQTPSTTTYRLNASGGVALVDGRTMLSRRIGDAFAIVEVPDYEDIGIYVSNQVVARTDQRGVAMV
ncbi:MAG: fimbria/pilus outer membrane usher protein, partial [Burkholderiales bacterium]